MRTLLVIAHKRTGITYKQDYCLLYPADLKYTLVSASIFSCALVSSLVKAAGPGAQQLATNGRKAVTTRAGFWYLGIFFLETMDGQDYRKLASSFSEQFLVRNKVDRERLGR